MSMHPSHPEPEHRPLPPEPSDIPVGPTIAVGLVVVALIAIAMVVSAWMLFPRKQFAHSPPSPLAFLDNPTPAPHLEFDPPADLASLRAHEEELLTTYGWVDRQAGIYRIPIAAAMKLLAARGAAPGPQPPAEEATESPGGGAETQASEPTP